MVTVQRVAFAFLALIPLASETARSQTTLTSPAPSTYDRFGCSVALDGQRLVIGARYDTPNGVQSAGSAFVYERVGSSWVLRAQLVASDADVNDDFGVTVAIDGDTILVGADNEGENGNHHGAAYVFVRNGTQWLEQAKFVSPHPAPNSFFGRALAISGDTAVVAAPSDSSVSSLAGSVHIFVRSGAIWTLQTSLAVTDSGYQAAFGGAVAIDGDTLLASTPHDDGLLGDEGSVHVFMRTGTTWIEQHPKLRAAAVPTDLFRFGATLDLEGDRVAIGTFSLPGWAYIFERAGGAWTQRAVLHASDEDPWSAFFGWNIDLDGDRLAVGAVGEYYVVDPANIVSGGAAYLYEKHGSAWLLLQRLIPPVPESNGWFGAVALSGSTLVVGEQNDGATEDGAVHVYEFGELASYCTAGTTTNGCRAHISIDGVAKVAGTTPAWLTATGVEGGVSGLIFVGASTNAAPWAPGGTSVLCIAQPLARIPPELATGASTGSCRGTFAADINGYLAAHGGALHGQPVLAGTTVHAQAWFRDPPAPKGSNLSDALTFSFAP